MIHTWKVLLCTLIHIFIIIIQTNLCMCVCIHTCIHTCKDSCVCWLYTHAKIRVYVDWTSSYPGACFHACVRACVHVCARVCRCTKRRETNLLAIFFFDKKDFLWLACKRCVCGRDVCLGKMCALKRYVWEGQCNSALRYVNLLTHNTYAHTYAHTLASMHMHTKTRVSTHSYTQIHIIMHTHTHTHTHTSDAICRRVNAMDHQRLKNINYWRASVIGEYQQLKSIHNWRLIQDHPLRPPLHMQTCMYVCVCVYVRVFVCVRACVCVSLYVHVCKIFMYIKVQTPKYKQPKGHRKFVTISFVNEKTTATKQ